MACTDPPTWCKDPSDVLDWRWDWSEWLAPGETIVTAVVNADPGISIDAQSYTATTVTVWLSGGSLGSTYKVPSKVTTSQGRTVERNIIIEVADR